MYHAVAFTLTPGLYHGLILIYKWYITVFHGFSHFYELHLLISAIETFTLTPRRSMMSKLSPELPAELSLINGPWNYSISHILPVSSSDTNGRFLGGDFKGHNK